MLTNIEKEIELYLERRDYSGLSLYLEEMVETKHPSIDVQINLGLAYLLSHDESAAQMVWLSTFSTYPGEEDEILTIFSTILEAEAARQETIVDIDRAFLIRTNLFEADSANTENLLSIVRLITLYDFWNSNESYFDELIEILDPEQDSSVHEPSLIEVLRILLEKAPMHPRIADFMEVSCQKVQEQQALLSAIFPALIRMAHSLGNPGRAAQISEVYLKYHPNSIHLLGQTALFLQDAQQYESGILTAERFYELNTLPVHKVFASHLLVRGLLSSGLSNSQTDKIIKRHSEHLKALTLEEALKGNNVDALRLFLTTFFLPYINDSLENVVIRSNIVSLACQHFNRLENHPQSSNLTEYRAPKLKSSSRIRVGYLSHCFKVHSVGWLARSLIQHHDRQAFEVYGYSASDYPNDSVQQWYKSTFDHYSCLETDFSNNISAFYAKIKEDEVDILIDLDSITLDVTCELLAMKPAPIQATWLGWDAIGMSAIDYFIADPYVLPDHAQDYYVEKIYRLPETYLAIDGFEVAIPTLRREDLNILVTDVIFLTAQRGYKRHRETATLQMNIIAGTPNSYLLIKGFADDQAIQTFFNEIADEVGVDRDRLRFLASDPSEAVHRANLRIADVVLDTYPYNGATTTMETLWMEVPIVTRVGEQFAARNSYTMMMNAGITEGIAWSAEEYIEWGIRLGTDPKLRQEISWRLRESKKTAPLWDAKRFTKHMEEAYQQMWKIYVERSQTVINVEGVSETSASE